MPRHHTIISGTGRAGTTFLVQLMTALGLDTGFSSPESGIFSYSNAGMELDIRNPESPYIVKSPWLCDYLDNVLEQGDVVIDHAIIPVRDLYAAAESRRDVSARGPKSAAGGLWHTTSPDQQEDILLQQLYKITHTLAKRDVPVTLLSFPRHATDPEYLYQKLDFLFGNIPYEQFLETFNRISRPDLIHRFSKAPEASPPAVKPAPAPGYFGHPRPEVVSLVPREAKRVLDIGCAAGLLGKSIKDRQECHVTGIELNPAAAAEAAKRLDLVMCGDALMWLDQLPEAGFDAIVMADVIEHLDDTAGLLSKVRSRLAPGGVLVASIPNIRHWSVLKSLLEGEWRYVDAGILDRTHLRFFTRRSFRRCLDEARFETRDVRAVVVNGMTLPANLGDTLKSLGIRADDLEQEATHYQYLFVAARPD